MKAHFAMRRTRWWILAAACFLIVPNVAAADYLSDGRQALLKGDLRLAAAKLRNAVNADPQNAEAHFLLAKVQLDSGDPQGAQKEAKAALARGYDKQQVLPLLISSYLAQGKNAEILEEFEVGNKDSAADALILTARGYAYYGLQQLEDAEKAFSQAQRLSPNSLQPPLALARLAIGRGDLAVAQEKLDNAVRIAPSAPDVQLLKTQVLRMRNDAPAALALLNDIIAAQPNSLRARADRAGLYLALGRDADAKADNEAILALKPNDAQAIFISALLAARAQDFKLAEARLEKLSRYLGRVQRGYLLQAVIKENLGQLEQAEEAASRYVGKEVDDLDGIKLLARIRLLKRKPVPVIEALGRIAAVGRADAEIYDLLGRAFSLNGQSEKAVQALTLAQNLAPADVGVSMRLASAHLQNGETEAGIADMERSLRLAPRDAAVGERLFAASLSAGDFAKAKDVLGKVTASSGSTPASGNLEAVLLMQADLRAAKAKLESVNRQDPDFIPAKLNLALLASTEGKGDEADRLLKDILGKNPSSAAALGMYVDDLAAGARIAEGIQVMEQARAASAGDNALVSTLADLYVQAGNANKALALTGGDGQLSLLPTDLLAARMRAQLALGLIKDARDTCMELLSRDSADVAVRRTLAGLMVGLDDIESARNILLAGVKIDPAAFSLMQDLVALNFKAGGVEPALATVEIFERLNNDVPAVPALRGDVYMAAKRWSDAIAAYAKALKDAARPPTMLMIRLAAAQQAAGNTTQAAETVRSWLKAHSDDLAALQFLAELDLGARRYAEAEQDTRNLLAKRPRDAGLLNNLAWLYLQRGDKRARETAQQAYLLRPDAETADTLGWIMLSEGDVRPALTLLGQANAGAGKDAGIGYHYAVALQKNGRGPEAAKILKPILDSDQPFDERGQATKLLGELSKGA
jgi:putative PEP-CTERM system TPR-repeat lipoprotein